MSRLLYALRGIVWSAVLAVVLSSLAVVCAVAFPNFLALPIAFGLSALVSAILSQRA
jgi:hypothetical protein